MNTRFIIEVYCRERWGDSPSYVATLGNKCCLVEFGGLYQARFFDKKQTAEKAAERVKRYIDEAGEKGYSTYAYGYNPDVWHPVFGLFSGRMRSSDMEVYVKEVELRFV